MDDLISRQALCEYALNQKDKSVTPNDIMRFPSVQPETHEERIWGVTVDKNVAKVWDQLKDLPSAQPERLTDDDFETIRIHLNAYKEKLCNQHRWKEAEEYQGIIDRFMAFASAQTETCAYWDREINICALHRQSAQPYIDPCETCQYSSLDCDEEPCDSCTMGGETNHYKPYTEADIQKMQDLEQAELEKAFKLGRQDAMSVIVTCNDCKYSHMTYDGKCKYCDIWFPDEAEYMDGNYYCGSAERKEYVEEA